MGILGVKCMSKEEKKYIQDNSHLSNKILADKLGRTINCIYKHKQQQGLLSTRRRKFSIYTRYCRRCGCIFKTESKTSRNICDFCNLNNKNKYILQHI